ncbi:unnamed protein product [Miscanthus lutarioriparius]|uniref:Uncharacterized protein n=1 Tax=Miscanthus lutarioriparius TaxID=422564 RepID=A0A811Q8Z2_9POAL|nr:unnamed protein product [Miscanthus lutarioriparius]
MRQWTSSIAAHPHVDFLRLVAEPRPLTFRVRHLNAPSPRPGCLMKPIKVEALKSVINRDVLVPDIRHKDEQSGMPEMIDAIGTALRSMGDGEISISAYDTAWVALVKSLNGDNTPQFPSCIDWIARNQLLDGSWGLSFISENMWRLANDDDNWTLCGFEIIFPMLLEKAKNLGVNIPLDDPTLEAIYAKRELKFTKIPRDALHVVPTTFLLSIEGMPGLDWKRLCKLQCPDGSFMSSPAPTAYALMQTGDPKCFEFLDRVVSKFNGSGTSLTPPAVPYRTNLFSNDMYLKVAKADFSKFQRLCRLEWHSLKRWCGKNNLEMYGVTRQSALRAYFLAAASNFEPSRAAERLAWARTAVLAEAISGCLLMSSNTHDDRTMTAEWLVDEFVNSDDDNPASGRGKKNSRVTSSLGYALRDLIDIHASGNASVADCLRGAWKEWFMAWTKTEREGPRAADTAMLLVRTVEICSGRHHSTEQDMKLLPDYSKLEQLTRSICCRLATEAPALNGENMDKIDDLDRMVGFEMQELAQCVFQSCSSINRETRQTFLHVTKSYYYVALCSHETIEHHISKDSVVPTEIIRGLLRLVFVYVGKDAQNFLLNKYQRNRCHVREKVEESLHLMLNAQRNKNCMSSDPELLFPSSLKHNHVRRLRLCLHTSHPMATPIQVSILAALQELWKQVCWAGQWHHSLVVMIGEAFE